MTTVRLSKDLVEQGYSYMELARMARKAELVRVRRGAYADPEPSLDPRVAHLRLLEATVAQSAQESVVSHASAAVLHDLPIGTEHLDRVHLTRDRAGQGKIRRYVQVHGSALDDGDVVELRGFQVTSLARTVLDLGCTLRHSLPSPSGTPPCWRGCRPSSWPLSWTGPADGTGSPRRGVRPPCWTPAARAQGSR